MDDYNLNINMETWRKVCNFRRIKNESEFKMSIFKKDAIEKAHLLDFLKRDIEDNELSIKNLKTSIINLENQEKCYENDSEVKK